MISLINLLFVVIVIWVFLRTVSYGRWTWKKKNKLGGAMIMLLALALALLTVYQTFMM